MLLLKLTLVVLISEIGERALCAASGPAPSANEDKDAPVTLPPESLLDGDTSGGCGYKVLPYFDGEEETGFTGGGFLALNCTKSCRDERVETVTDGNECIANVDSVSKEEATVTVGTCMKGSCKPGSSPQQRIVTLIQGEEEEEEGVVELQGGEEKKEEEEEEE
uniref:Evasin n=1 Tax=Ixodes ricinus TaxID=34613 RepID=A0A0K8R9I3_IXORI